jgi:cytochrome P450
MLHDDDVFPDPMGFSPERYLDNDVGDRWKYIASSVDPRVAAFGYGRRCVKILAAGSHLMSSRFCPGRDLAIVSMWNTIVLTLHLFNITSKESHPPPLREHEFKEGLVS